MVDPTPDKRMEPATPGPSGHGLHVQLVCCTETLLSEIKLLESTRKDIAMTYALALTSEEKTDWAAVNMAIMNRWGPSGLQFVKRHAWKLYRRWNNAPQARMAPEPPAKGSHPHETPRLPHD